jgi:DNA repair photolyase
LREWINEDHPVHFIVEAVEQVSYNRAVQMTEETEKEVAELLQKAEEAGSRPLEDGLRIPEEIKRREERKAKREMEKRYEEAKRERTVPA